ncbi:very short patch repair endonuclease [Brevundimonas naejangsanensis]|uniref:Very short patch repair endonuclease n=1 Tax=Brevundimonas naejangsanensis TaxID=588932 RepID=A0A172Y2U7_9CAUL|nr:very short patch repair endonuclease [Brevundimonas naejangsanensis]ANF53533.1 very short patch repair endonuclease [Brevundimonas naejangsanensis]
MADIVDPATRSRMMSAIRGADTRPELLVRRHLHAAGFRFRLHARELRGRPDVVMPRWNAAVFVHGCFWHRHTGCRYATTPATRPDFWREKFDRNMQRDAATLATLEDEGWRVATVWECALRREPAETLEALAAWIGSGAPSCEFGAPITPP